MKRIWSSKFVPVGARSPVARQETRKPSEPGGEQERDNDRAANDAALVARVVAGDKPAEEELEHRFRRGMVFMLTKRVGNPVEAEDLWQDTLIATIQALRRNRLEDASKLSSFIWGIAVNLANNHFRKGQREQTRSLEQDHHMSEQPSPLTVLLDRERNELVRKAVASVKPVHYRDLLYRFYIHEDDKEKICADLNLSAESFNMRLFRARKKLYKILARRVHIRR